MVLLVLTEFCFSERLFRLSGVLVGLGVVLFGGGVVVDVDRAVEAAADLAPGGRPALLLALAGNSYDLDR